AVAARARVRARAVRPAPGPVASTVPVLVGNGGPDQPAKGPGAQVAERRVAPVEGVVGPARNGAAGPGAGGGGWGVGTGGSAPAGSGAAAPELSGGRAGERTGRGGALRRGWRRTRCGSRSAAGASSSTATPASSW